MWVKLDYRWRIRLTLPPFTSLVVERLVYMVIWIHRGRSREMNLQVRLNIKESCISNFVVIPFHIRIKSIVLQWSLFRWRNFMMFGSNQPFADCSILPLSEQAFQWVQKNFCGTFPSMWKIFSVGVFGLETWRTSLEFDAREKGRWIKSDKRIPTLPSFIFLVLKGVVEMAMF